MKLNITVGGPARNGWLNLDPIADPQDQSRVRHDINNIDSVVDNNECKEVVALDVLDFFPLGMKEQVLKHWMAKVEHSGTFALSGVDLDRISYLANNKQLNTEQVNLLLYGPCNNMWLVKKGLLTLSQAADLMLSTQQFKIVSKEIVNGLSYIIKAERL